MLDMSLKADMISFLKASKYSRVTKSLRMLSNMPCNCEFEIEPSLECGKLLYSIATQTGCHSPLASRAFISAKISFRSLTFLSVIRLFLTGFAKAEKKISF